MNVGLWLSRHAKTHGSRSALFHGNELVADYAGFHNGASKVASLLKKRMVKPGDRVGIYMNNHPDYLLALHGCWYAGAVVVPINAKLHAKEVSWILADSGASMCFSRNSCESSLRKTEVTCPIINPDLAHETCDMEPEYRSSDDLAWLFYTSGTTGRPKGVKITHGMLASVSLSYLADVDFATPADATLYCAPISHGAGLYCLVHVLAGARHVVPQSGGFTPREILDLAESFNDAHFFAAPTMVRRLTEYAKANDLPGMGIRTIVYGGGPMYVADIVEAVDHFGAKFIQIYGQGEAPMAITALSRADVADRSHAEWRERLASVGRAQSIAEVQIGDREGRPLPQGEVGEIMVRGDLVMPGYWNNDEGTSSAFCNGWLMTGDMGCLNEDGYLTLKDRSKDLIVSGGANVYPREVEEVLLSHPAVAQASVIGKPSTEWGEDVVAFIVPDREVDEKTLDEFCLDNIARFKRPKSYCMVKELPTNNYGKVIKAELRKMLEEKVND